MIFVIDDMNELHKRSLYNIKRYEKSSDIACTSECFTAMVNNGYPLRRIEVWVIFCDGMQTLTQCDLPKGRFDQGWRSGKYFLVDERYHSYYNDHGENSNR